MKEDKKIYRVALVEWRDQYNTDTYYLNELMNAPTHHKTIKNAVKWCERHEKEINQLIDTNYTSDLYIEEWRGEWITNELLYKNLFIK